MIYSEIKNKAVTVRKPHRCAWCAELINVGESAQHRAYVFDGDFQADWMHPECRDAMADYPCQNDLLEGWTPGDFARGSVCEPEYTPVAQVLDAARLAGKAEGSE